jgi:phosphinothricin acetyltransferase
VSAGQVRRAGPADAAAICALANPVIRDTTITFTTEPRREEAVAALVAAQPHWVAEAGGGVVGFATHFPFRAGPGYAFTREHSVMLAPGARGRGLGRALMAAVEADAAAQGIHTLWAGISAENAPACAFHAALGFAETARLPQVGRKFGRWIDLILMHKVLSDAGPPG